VHLELFANGRVVIVPAAVGVGGAHMLGGNVQSAHCRAHAWTLDPTGTVRFDRATTLGQFFTVWGRQLAPSRLLSFGGAVRVYVNGRRHHVDARTLGLRDGDEIVLEVGRYVRPHASYLFPPH
jgi:hypothetical protein